VLHLLDPRFRGDDKRAGMTLKGMIKNKQAFTLIELLLVIAIIGILTSAATVSYLKIRAGSRDVKRLSSLSEIQNALALYYRDEGSYPTTLTPGGSLVGSSSAQVYLSTIPALPNQAEGACSTGDNQFIYATTSHSTAYTISFCLGAATAQLNSGPKCATPAGIINLACSEAFITACSVETACGTTCSYDNKNYPTVLIGSQCWLAKNLNIGTMITSCASGVGCPSNDPQNQADYSAGNIQKYCYNDLESNCATDGGLYQWHTAMGFSQACDSSNNPYVCWWEGQVKGICPSGWHIPSDGDWQLLEQGLADDHGCSNSSSLGCYPAGDKLKKCYNNPDSNNTNIPDGSVCGSSNFDILLVGYRYIYGQFRDRGVLSAIWSSKPDLSGSDSAWYRYAQFNNAGFGSFSYDRINGFSVRCIKN